MIAKFAIALAIAWLGWYIWKGPRSSWTTGQRGPVRSDAEMKALAILGLPPTATIEEIRSAHRRLLRNVHPDHGGTDELARRVNEARDILIKPGD